MGWWSAYFLVKLILNSMGYLDFHLWLNLAFAVFTALPPRNARQRFTKNLLAVPIGVLLLYQDSWLPPFAQAAMQLQNLRAFSPEYLWELAGRLVRTNPAPHVALYYNTISLHDGNRVLGAGHPDSSYGARFLL